ncbi:MAG: hypothetical protein FWC92_03865 [Defluviitaleaceae bacterium]|nr:hypothetical protein [Defluviitaleaceae bacterium]
MTTATKTELPTNITALRMERQHLTNKASEDEYRALYRDSQPGQNVYWSGFGDPPSLTYRATFDDIEFNRHRQMTHELIKGRFTGGNLGWIIPKDLELFAAAFMKPLLNPTPRQSDLLNLITQQPLTIHQMKEDTGMLVKEITPALHRLQEAFLIYEDQYDGEWDRGWHMFGDMFPDICIDKYTRHDALKVLLQRFAYRLVCFDIKMAKSFYKLPDKDLKTVLTSMEEGGIIVNTAHGYILREDAVLLETYTAQPSKSVFALHRNDMLVKANAHWLKDRFTHSYPDTLYYMLIDGVFMGAVAGKFRYAVEIEDVVLDLAPDEAAARKDEILQAVHYLCGGNNPIKRYASQVSTFVVEYD